MLFGRKELGTSPVSVGVKTTEKFGHALVACLQHQHRN
jgi:hypothetical protein